MIHLEDVLARYGPRGVLAQNFDTECVAGGLSQRPLLTPLCGQPKPKRDPCRLHRLVYDIYQRFAQVLKIHLIAPPDSEGL